MYREYWNAVIAGWVLVMSLVLTGCQPEPDSAPESDTAAGIVLVHNARIYTGDAGFMEDETGSLEAGKRADFIVLDRDIMAVPAGEIFQIVVEQTWLGGAV